MVNYRVKIKNKNYWETFDQGGYVYPTLGDCLAFLNRVYDRVYGNLFDYNNSIYESVFDKQKIFIWSITDKENTYTGIVEIDNKNFLEKILKIDLTEYKKNED
jgi:hypothetical protein